MLTAPEVQPSVPQWQKSEGCLIVMAALELSSKQITHFSLRPKNNVQRYGPCHYPQQ